MPTFKPKNIKKLAIDNNESIDCKHEQFLSNFQNNNKYTLPQLLEERIELIKKFKCEKLNIDENPETPQKYGVRGIPTLMMFRDGKLIDTKVGSLPKSSLIERINNNL